MKTIPASDVRTTGDSGELTSRENRPGNALCFDSCDSRSTGTSLHADSWRAGDESSLAQLRRSVNAIIAWRRRRARFFPADLFSDPVWDMLLDLALARIDGRPLQVSYVGIEAGVPSSTSLRWMKYLGARGLVRRWRDPLDKRRELAELSDDGLQAFQDYLEEAHRRGQGLF